MKKIIMLSLLVLMSFSMSSQLAAETPGLTLYNIDPSGYPVVRVTYSLQDETAEEIRTGIGESDITVNETETSTSITREREKLDPFCALPGEKAFSAILVIDLSQSMSKGVTGTGTAEDPYTGKSRFEVAKLAMLDWISKMNPYNTEVAIVGFAAQGYVIHEFSIDKPSLEEAVNKLKLTDVIGEVGNGTNYNAGLLWETDHRNNDMYFDEHAALHFCKPEIAKYTPAIVFMTDGNHQTDVKRTYDVDGNLVGKVLVGEINTLAKERDAHIFIIQIGGDELNGPSQATLNYLVQINNGSQSNLKLKIDSEEQLINTYREIHDKVADVAKPPKCYFDYITDCDGGGTLDVAIQVGEDLYTATAEVEIPEDLKPRMKIEYKGMIVNEILIEDDNPANDDVVTDITIKARDNDIIITGYSSTNPNYSIEDLPSGLAEGEEVIVKLLYKSGTTTPAASDSLANQTIITILSDACEGNTMGAAWEMVPYLEDAAMDGTVVGTPKETTIIESFCNKTHEDITITKIEISGADAAVFKVVSKFPQTVPAGTCIDIIYEFNPPSDGAYQADLTLTTSDNDTYTAIIYGNGSGKASIAHDAFTIPNTNCASPNSTFDVIVNNTGPVDMNVSDADIVFYGAINGFTEAIEFDLKNGGASTIAANGSNTYTIDFSPLDQRLKDAVLQITGDADNAKIYDIQLLARQDSVDFGLSQTTINLGVVCLDDVVDTDIDISALTGVSADFVVDCTPAQANISIDNNSWSLTSDGTTQTMKVTYTGDGAGDFSEVITFTDADCGRTHTITLTGTAADPQVLIDQIDIASTVGVASTIQKILENLSKAGFTVIDVTTDNLLFEIINKNLGFVDSGNTFDFEIVYTPDDGIEDDAVLTIELDNCGPLTIPLKGLPAQATADLFIDKNYTGVAGTSISIPIDLNNPNQFVESNTASIEIVLVYDVTMLDITNSDAIKNVDGVTLNIDITPLNVDMPAIYTLEFDILSSSLNTDTEIEFDSADSDKGNVVFNKSSGLFTLNPSTATLSIDNFTAEPGQVINIPIKMSDVINVSAENNTSITATLRYKASMLDPIDTKLTDKGTVVGDERVIDLPEMQIPDPLTGVLATFKFKAMLGTDKITDVILENADVIKGAANFDIESAVMTLTVCESGDVDRFFDPNSSSALMLPVPNPASGMTEIMFETEEESATEVYICDLLGNKVRVLYNDTPIQGPHSLEFDASEMNSGMYFIILKTPTRTISKKFRVVK